MTIRVHIKSILLTALVSVSLGGFLLHCRIHPISGNPANLVPAISGILGIFVVPLLFSFKKTISYGYVANGILAIVGAVLMAHFAIAHWPQPATFESIVVKTTFADILILAGKFFLGKALFDLETFGYDSGRAKAGASYRYPNMGWWLVHLMGITVVYSLGKVLWR